MQNQVHWTWTFDLCGMRLGSVELASPMAYHENILQYWWLGGSTPKLKKKQQNNLRTSVIWAKRHFHIPCQRWWASQNNKAVVLTIHHSLGVRAISIMRRLMTNYQWLLILRDLLQRWFPWGHNVLRTLSGIFMLLLLLITWCRAKKWLDKVWDCFRGFAPKRIGDGKERVWQSAQSWSPQKAQIGWVHATKNVNRLPVKGEQEKKNRHITIKDIPCGLLYTVIYKSLRSKKACKRIKSFSWTTSSFIKFNKSFSWKKNI